MARRRKGRPITGIILLDKPPGWSSNALLQKVRWLFQAQKAGHTGALDPMATGLLPICLGEATKFTRFLLDADKAYQATACLGVRTDTLDAEGQVVEANPVPELTEAAINQRVQDRFTGTVLQVPPMYSALKRDGRKLYELARQGIEIEREARPVVIHQLSDVQYEAPQLRFEVACSKGTYIRTLVDDIGTELGCGAHLTALRRTQHGRFLLAQAVTLEALLERHQQSGPSGLDDWLMPLDELLQDLPRVDLSALATQRFAHGNAVALEAQPDQDPVRVYGAGEAGFLGIGRCRQGLLKAVRLVATGSQ
ncbi:MAG: tRNA pseudouridine(55) synthase TruB [Saccharospirillum sp.]